MLLPVKWVRIFPNEINFINVIPNMVIKDVINYNDFITSDNTVIMYGSGMKLTYLQVFLIMCTIWLSGVAILAIKQIILYQKSRMVLYKYSSKIENLNILHILDEEKEKLNIKSNIQILCSHKISSPTVFGIFRKTIILPAIQISDTSIRLILRHELVHIKRQDILLKLICVLVKIVHWYNPAAYLIYYEVSLLIEFSCDEEVLLNCSFSQKKQYATMIINTIRLTKNIETITPNFVNTQKAGMKKRICNILATKHKTNKLAVLCLAGAIFIGLIFCGYSDSPVDCNIKGATLLETQKWYLWGHTIKNTTATSDKDLEIESEPTNISATKINDRLFQDIFADSIIEIETDCSGYNYVIPDLITNTADMAIFTTSNDSGWKLNSGQSITIQFELDTDTVKGAKKTGSVVEVGYIFNGNIVPISEEMGSNFINNITINKDGEYYLYITNHASGYQIIKNGLIKIG